MFNTQVYFGIIKWINHSDSLQREKKKIKKLDIEELDFKLFNFSSSKFFTFIICLIQSSNLKNELSL